MSTALLSSSARIRYYKSAREITEAAEWLIYILRALSTHCTCGEINSWAKWIAVNPLIRTAPCRLKPMSNENCYQSQLLEPAHVYLSQSRPTIVQSRWDPTWERQNQDKKHGRWISVKPAKWLYLLFRRTRRAVMAARVPGGGSNTSKSLSFRLIVRALLSSMCFVYWCYMLIVGEPLYIAMLKIDLPKLLPQ